MTAPNTSAGTSAASMRRTSSWRRTVRGGSATIVAVFVVGIVLGMLVGRATAPSEDAEVARILEQRLLPLVIDADGIWTAASDDRPPVAEALVALRHDDDPRPTLESHDEWIAAYDSVLVQLAGVDVPAPARSVQRQLMWAVTLSRDAVEVLGHAARLEPGEARQDMTTEVGRLRRRSEQLAQSARASISDLAGQRADVAPPSPLTGFDEGRR